MRKYLFDDIHSSFEAYILFSVAIVEAEMNLIYRKSFLATKQPSTWLRLTTFMLNYTLLRLRDLPYSSNIYEIHLIILNIVRMYVYVYMQRYKSVTLATKIRIIHTVDTSSQDALY